MTGFLAQLAGLALGGTANGGLRLALPPRFAPPSPAGPGLDDAALAEPAAAFARNAPEPLTARAGEPELRAGEPAVGPGLRQHERARELKPDRRPMETSRSSNSPVPPGERAASALAVSPAEPARQTRESSPAAPEAPVTDTVRPVPPAPTIGLLTPTQPGEGDPGQSPPERDAAPLVLGERPFAPLSAGAVAGRGDRHREADPVIHVTIDRIDVRASTPARPVQPSRRRPVEPSLSLSEFLRGDPGGAR